MHLHLGKNVYKLVIQTKLNVHEAKEKFKADFYLWKHFHIFIKIQFLYLQKYTGTPLLEIEIDRTHPLLEIEIGRTYP